MQLLQLFENYKISKVHKSGQNCHFYLSIKQLIRLETIINSSSGRPLKNAVVEF